MRPAASTWLLGIGLAATACQPPPPDELDGTTGAPDVVEYPDGHYPLVDGARWTYRHVAADATTWDEVVEMTAIEFDGRPAFEIADNEGLNGKASTSVLVREGGQVLRVHKDVTAQGVALQSVDYDPGFLRFDEAWTAGDVVDWTYERTEYDPEGHKTDVATRYQRYTVEATAVEVTVPAGTFSCVQFLRARDETGETKRFWFAAGVGKVQHTTLETGAQEQLVELDVP